MPNTTSILDTARHQVLEDGIGLDQSQLIEILNLPDEDIPALMELAHQVRLKWCGEEIEVEGIISLKTGGCPEDCHFCSQSGLFESPVRSVWLDIEQLVEAAKQTAKSGATEFCIVAAVKGPDDKLMNQLEEAVAAIQREVDIEVAASVGSLTPEQVTRLARAGVHRYNHNLETARSFFPEVVTTHTWEERRETLRLVAEAGMEVCSGGILGMGETLEQRAEFAVQLAELNPTEVPINFLDPRPGTPFADRPLMESEDALRAIGAFRLAMPHTMIRFAGGRELTLGAEGSEQGLLGGINAIIVGNYLTTLGRPMEDDLEMMDRLQLPLKVLNKVI
ncbi:biotin synthase BioB [Corynebacterium gallinarum]|uniref:Biotin synthase n=1 Tax=Corynebacterium gallinarum TaxID=2762214 RepID=A0A8I0HH09_9CORY|nr:biotin synthase BioB [Corynebacterium gallinarum]MBD8029833.1 biotin synthase BioB [Corynebacterium gallinarum]NMB22335.1 biotin synthase BioB [Corynebacterium sp.]